MKIVVNGTQHEVSGTSLAYEDVIRLAGVKGNPSVAYAGPRHSDGRREGTMYTGTLVCPEDGMSFTVVHTGNA